MAVHAGQESMPAGMAKILEMLGAAMDLCSPDGELTVNDTMFYVEKGKTAKVIAQYKTPAGLYDSSGITCSNGAAGTENKMEKTKEFELAVGAHKILYGDAHAIEIKVAESAAPVAPAQPK